MRDSETKELRPCTRHDTFHGYVANLESTVGARVAARVPPSVVFRRRIHDGNRVDAMASVGAYDRSEARELGGWRVRMHRCLGMATFRDLCYKKT